MNSSEPNVPVSHDIADPDLDPCLILIKLEEEMIEDYSLNFRGITVNQPTNPVLTPTVAAAIVHTRYTDLMDVIDDKLTNESLRARVLPSLAWMIDSTIITNARIFLFDEFKNSEFVGTSDGLDVFMREFVGALDIEHVFGGGGPATTLVQLLGLRNKWHDAAGSALDAVGRVYDPRNWDALINNEKPQSLKPDQRKRQQMLIAAMVEMEGGDKSDIELLSQEMAKRSEMRALSRVELNKRVGPTVIDIIETATRHCDHSTQFEHLDKMVRERLFKVSIKFVKNAVGDLAEFNISDTEYMEVLMNMKKFIAAVDLILATQYRDDPAQHIKNVADRNSKKAAAGNQTADFEADVAQREAVRDAAQ